MRAFDRPEEAPPILRSKAAQASRRRMLEFWSLERQRRAQTSVPFIGMESTEDLVQVLAALTHGKCAFCEAPDRLQVHRFRPMGNALPASGSNPHLYYLWLADAWQNLYPICESCIPSEPQFPVSGARAKLPAASQVELYVERGDGTWSSYPPREDPLLLEPGWDERLETHFVPKLDGEIMGNSKRGEQTIATFDLNRSMRRDQRYQAYQSNLDLLLRLVSGVGSEEEWRALFDFAEMPFGGTWFMLLRRIARWIGGVGGTRPRTSEAHIRSFYVKLSGEDDSAGRVQAALDAIARDDASYRPGRWEVGAVHSLRAPIAEVEIQNFKAIERLRLSLTRSGPPGGDRDLSDLEKSQRAARAPALMILGENATGKSSILEAIALALTTQPARNALELSWPRLVLDPSQMGEDRRRAGRRAEVRVTLTSGQSATLSIVDGEMNSRTEFGNEQVPVFAYGAFRRFETATRRPSPHKHIRNLFDGSILSNPEPWLKALPKDAFDMVVRTLRDLLSIEGNFDVIQRERSTRQLRMVTALAEPDGTVRFNRTPLNAVSSGYRSMLAMLCDIMRGLLDKQVYEGFEDFQTARGIVLIDEIEAHLHPRWKVQVMSSLRAALPRMTFITTTHDPLCLRGMEDHEVVVLQRVAAGDALSSSGLRIVVEQMEGLPAASDLRIDQLLTSDFFQLFSTDDAAAERKLANVAQLLSDRAGGRRLEPDEERVVEAFGADIANALPVGSSEVHRIVQDAVAVFLAKRREATSSKLERLKDEARNEIVRALEAL